MGQKDLSEKILVAYDDVFADIVNVLMFNGQKKIQPEELEDRGTKDFYKEKGMLHELERDVVKRWRKGEVRFACIGIENQTAADPDMTLRVIGYDGAAYRVQLSDEKQSRERYPVITIVLYFGYDKKWDKPLHLLEKLTIPDGLDPYVSDYKVNLFQVAWLSDEQIAMFQSDFKVVVDYFVQKRKNNSYTPTKTEIKHVEAVLQLLSVMEHDDRFVETIYSEDGGKVKNMCDVLDIAEQRGEARGVKLGEERGAKTVIDLIRRLLNGEDESAIRKSGVNDELLKMAVGVLQKQ
ncbi:MAG: Rpn family recombination-promoting nuclease/putative transposase [Lachnospiraceae bacterium]